MTTTLFPNDKPLNISEIESTIRDLRWVETDTLAIFVNRNEVEHIIKTLKNSNVLDRFLIYESEFVDRGNVYITTVYMAEAMRPFIIDHKLNNDLLMQYTSGKHELSVEDEIKNIKKKIRRSKSYLEKHNLQKKLCHLEKLKTRRRGKEST